MIKTRLVALLSQAKKYIIQNVFWQWAALLAQIAAVFSAAGLLEGCLFRKDRGISIETDRADPGPFRLYPLCL